MKKLFFILVFGIAAFAGCQTASKVKDVKQVYVPINDEQIISRAIIKGAMERGWEITESNDNVIKANLKAGYHIANVEISYGKDYYSIKKDNKSLKYYPKRYNRWMAYLERSINNAIAEEL